jgi:hypothetical protein
MNNIFKTNSEFDFSNISLAQPTMVQGGSYFTKILFNKNALYIETPLSLTKQGFVKSGKKMYCDLMFTNSDQEMIDWLENLETTCQKLIYEKSESWFENKLELNDVESAFTSPLRVYKSGKYYLVRVNVKMNYVTNTPQIKIYNEYETTLTTEDVVSETQLISILEVQGVKFTNKNFQIDLELKQAMVLNTDEIFETCLIKTNSNLKRDKSSSLYSAPSSLIDLEKLSDSICNENVTLSLDDTNNNNTQEVLENIDIEDDKTVIEEMNVNNDSDELEECDIAMDTNNLETINLKKPNDVFYEIYKKAREKARQLKKETIQAYLEAKNIKNTYMLDELVDSDDESESELKNTY